MNRRSRLLRPALAAISATLGLVLVAISLVGLVAGSPAGDHGGAQQHRASEAAKHLSIPSNPFVAAMAGNTLTPSPSPLPAAPPPPAAPLPAPPPPTVVRIPSIGVDSPLVDLGLNPDGTLEVPDDFSLAGWYVHRPVPGEPGPAVIAGHIDSKTGPAVFYKLPELAPGALVEVGRADGSVARFEVVTREQHDKDSFPTERVYGPTQSSELRLITCGGDFDRSSGHYVDNVVVFARLLNVSR